MRGSSLLPVKSGLSGPYLVKTPHRHTPSCYPLTTIRNGQTTGAGDPMRNTHGAITKAAAIGAGINGRNGNDDEGVTVIVFCRS